MYLDYYGFDEPPFSITPDPRFVYLSEKHEESLAHLVYGITRGGGAGFVQLTGEVGTGKTTISRLLLDKIPEKTNIALILNPTITPVELLENICKELKVPLRGVKGKLNSMVDKLNDYLLKSWSDGENTVVMIDEAQNLPRDTLEQLRLLTNLETDKQKLLQIVLIGQPELRSTMRRNDLRQLAQRVTARYHLMPLSADETLKYLKHRIRVAGGNSNIVSSSTAKKVFQLTDGVPRLINVLMDRALLAAYSDDAQHINIKHLKIAAEEVLPESLNTSIKNTGYFSSNPMWATAFLLLIVVIIYQFFGPRINLNKSIAQENNAVDASNAAVTKKPNPQTETQKNFYAAPSNAVWSQYFESWDAKIEKNWHKPQCPGSIDTGMACLRRQGNLNQIKKMNRPVILQLDDSSLLLLSSMDNDKMGVLNRSNQTDFVDKNWLEKQWLGTYFIIWPMPGELLQQHSPDQLQQWSLEMANTISSATVDMNNLEKWITDFQNENGLLADGIIGSETQMALSLNAYNGPTLK